MRNKLNFNAFKDASEIQKCLETHLPVGTATPIDVFSFLGEQELKHSGFIDNSRWAGSVAAIPFEHTIFTGVPVKRMGWPFFIRWLFFEAHWDIRFFFYKQKLAKIDVLKTVTGI